MSDKQDKATAYWKENLKYLVILLSIWFLCSYGAGILFKTALDSFKLGGFPLGFWFAQQGSIYVFIILTRWVKLNKLIFNIVYRSVKYEFIDILN